MMAAPGARGIDDRRRQLTDQSRCQPTFADLNGDKVELNVPADEATEPRAEVTDGDLDSAVQASRVG